MIYEKIKESLYNGDFVTVHRCNSDGSIDNFLFFVTYIDVIRYDHEHLERDASGALFVASSRIDAPCDLPTIRKILASAPEACWSFGWIDPAE